MNARLVGLLSGVGFGFVLAWSRVTDPAIIRRMLLLQEIDVFLLMGSAIAVAALGVHLLRALRVRAFVTREPIGWTLTAPTRRHAIGSVIFGVGWSIAGTCPGPVTAMIGEGRLGGLFVLAGLMTGLRLQAAFARRATEHAALPDSTTACV